MQSNKQEDEDFDPSAEALIDEIDDERTLEEEEALNGNAVAAVQEELDDLKKESEMPIEELLAYYERMRNEMGGQPNSDEDEEENDEEEEEEEDKGEGEEEEEKKEEAGKGKCDDEEDINIDGEKKDQTQHQQQSKNGLGSKKTVESHSETGKTNPIDSSLSNLEQKSSQDDEAKHCHSSIQTQQHPHPPQISVQRHKYQPNCGILDSDTHSISITSNSGKVLTNPESVQQSISSSSGSGNCGQITRQPQQLETHDDSIAEARTGSQGQSRPHMTDFFIDDESAGIFKSLLGHDLDDSDDLDEDYSYTDDEYGDDERDWRRVIHVGPEHQADVAEGLCEYDDLPPYENQDKLVWQCKPSITREEILDYLKRASSLSKKNEISVSPASVPKISNDNMRLYREKMQDITSSTGSHIIEHNHENIIIDNPPETITDVYMRQSRKRMRIEYEIEQENAMDGLNSTCGSVTQSQLSNLREDKSDSTSQDARPELSTEEYFQDEEQLLFLLLQCNYNFDEALRRRKLDPTKYFLHEPMSLWSQDECLGFEHGLRTYGKNFRLIRENKVQTRTHAELVAFYYLWKKSERHDVYTNQYKLDRKRCLSHPGTTDYMDKFIEDNESILNASSSSPALTPNDSCNELNKVDTSSINSPQDQLSHSSGTLAPTIHFINLPQVSNIQRNHLQLNQQQKDDM